MIEVTVTYTTGETYTESFATERAARRFCAEEVKWENTKRVACAAIGFDQAGDFA